MRGPQTPHPHPDGCRKRRRGTPSPQGGEWSGNLNSCPRPLGEWVASGASRVRGSVTVSSSFTLEIAREFGQCFDVVSLGEEVEQLDGLGTVAVVCEKLQVARQGGWATGKVVNLSRAQGGEEF